MKKTLISLFTLAALAVGIQASEAACCSYQSSFYSYPNVISSPCAACPVTSCPCATPCCNPCPACPCQNSCNSCCNNGYNGYYNNYGYNNNCGCNNCCRKKCSWWKFWENKNCCYKDNCCGDCGCGGGCCQ